MFIFFPDTWRREVSQAVILLLEESRLTMQRSRAYQKAIEGAIKRALHTEQAREKQRQRKLAKGLSSSAATPAMTPGHATPSTRRHSDPDTPATEADAEIVVDAERGEVILYERDWRYLGFRKRPVTGETKITPSWRDINPLPVMATIFAKPTNAIVLLSSG